MKAPWKKEASPHISTKRSKKWGWYHLPLGYRPIFDKVVRELYTVEWQKLTEDYEKVEIFDLPIEVQRELYPSARFEDGRYRYRLIGRVLCRVRWDVAEDEDLPARLDEFCWS
jgi:hypothetical protein